jgi:DNA-binding response OmpR family regulator
MGIHAIVRADLAADRFNAVPVRRTLLLEHDDALHRNLQTILSARGHVLLDGRRTGWALHAIAAGSVDLVILNVGWPVTRREIVEEVVWRALPFFVYAQTGNQLWELRRTNGACMPEPFAPEEIAERIGSRRSPMLLPT